MMSASAECCQQCFTFSVFRALEGVPDDAGHRMCERI